MATDRDPRVRLTAGYYSASAEAYDALWGPALLPHSESLLRDLPLDTARRVLDLGSGTGALLPSILPGDLLSVLSTVRDERRARQEAAALLAQLTPRQTQILRALVSGRSTAQIAEALLISEHSARAHVKHILAKLGVHSKLQAVALALGQHFA